jgi:hypothetical protein
MNTKNSSAKLQSSRAGALWSKCVVIIETAAFQRAPVSCSVQVLHALMLFAFGCEFGTTHEPVSSNGIVGPPRRPFVLGSRGPLNGCHRTQSNGMSTGPTLARIEADRL